MPEPRDGQALIRVEWCGLCGTDLEEYRDGPVNVPVATPHPLSGRRAPVTLGHEVVGVVVDPGDGGPPAGARVIPDVVVGCGSCWWCARHQEGLCERLSILGLTDDGGLAEYVVARAETCVRVPEGLTPERAALAEPAAVAVRAVRKLEMPLGSSLLVLGAGTIGLLVLQAAMRAGLGPVLVCDPQARRRELALGHGALAALTPGDLAEAVPDLTGGRGPDAVIECSGAPGLAAEAIRCARRGGSVVLVGFHNGTETFDLMGAVLGEKRIFGSAAHLWDEDVETAVRLLAAGGIDVTDLITARIPLESVVERGFQAMGGPAPADLKILVAPQAASTGA